MAATPPVAYDPHLVSNPVTPARPVWRRGPRPGPRSSGVHRSAAEDALCLLPPRFFASASFVFAWVLYFSKRKQMRSYERGLVWAKPTVETAARGKKEEVDAEASSEVSGSG